MELPSVVVAAGMQFASGKFTSAFHLHSRARKGQEDLKEEGGEKTVRERHNTLREGGRGESLSADYD